MQQFCINNQQIHIYAIQKRIRTIINGLAACGLNATQTTNEDLRVILDNFLNGGMTTEFGTVMVS